MVGLLQHPTHRTGMVLTIGFPLEKPGIHLWFQQRKPLLKSALTIRQLNLQTNMMSLLRLLDRGLREVKHQCYY